MEKLKKILKILLVAVLCVTSIQTVSAQDTTEIDVTDISQDLEQTDSYIYEDVQDENIQSETSINNNDELLKDLDFSSKRLIVATDNPEIIKEDSPVISEYNGLYLIQYEDEESAKSDYLYYLDKAEFVEPDVAVSAADGESGGEMSENSNPFQELSTELENADGSVVQESAKVIALLDSGVRDDVHVIGKASMLADDGNDIYGHGNQMLDAILSVNPDAKVLSVKVLDDNGKGSISSVIAGMEYAMEQGANIINLSLSAKATAENSVLAEVIAKATAAGIEVVGAAGNNSKDVKWFMPGNVKEAIIVGLGTKKNVYKIPTNYGITVDYLMNEASTSIATAKVSALLSMGDIPAEMLDGNFISINANVPTGDSEEIKEDQNKEEQQPISNEDDQKLLSYDKWGLLDNCSFAEIKKAAELGNQDAIDLLNCKYDVETQMEKLVRLANVDNSEFEAAWGNAGTYISAGANVGGVVVEDIAGQKIITPAMNWKNFTIETRNGVNDATAKAYNISQNEQPNVKIRFNKVFSLGNKTYDVVLTSNKQTRNSRERTIYDDEWRQFTTSDTPEYISWQYIAYDGPTVIGPAIEFNTRNNPGNLSIVYLPNGVISSWALEYPHYQPDIDLTFNVYETGTTTPAKIKEMAWRIYDLDRGYEGLQVLDTVNKIYINKDRYAGYLYGGKNGSSWYFTGTPGHEDEGGDTNVDRYGLTIKTNDLSNSGQLDLRTYFYNRQWPHLSLAGVVFVGTQVKIVYRDVTDGKNTILKTLNGTNSDLVIGTVGEAVKDSYSTTETIKYYENKGYSLKKDNLTSDKKFTDNEYTIYVDLEEYKYVKQPESVKRTINYWYRKVNGEKAATTVTETKNFERTNKTKTDGTVVEYGTWSPASATFAAINNPAITKWYVNKVIINSKEQTDKTKAPSATVKAEDSDIVVDVIYMPYYTITTEVVNGVIDPKIEKIIEGSNKVINYHANEGYLLSTVNVDNGSNVANDNPLKYNFNNIKADHHIKVVYEKQEAPTKAVKDDAGEDINNLMVNKGSKLYYEITVKNPTANELEYTITDKVPEYTSFVSADNNGVNNDGTVSWKVKVPAKGSKVVKFVVETTHYAKAEINKAATSVTDKAGNTITLDTNTVINYTPDIVSKAVKNETGDINSQTQIASNNMVYEISFRNPADVTKTFTVTDKLPKGVTFISADNNGKNNNNTVTWTLELKAKEEKTVSVTVNILDSAKDTILKNKATVIVDKSSEDTNEVENPVLPDPIKHVYKEDTDVDTLQVEENSLLIYTITFKNPADEEKEFTITDEIDEHLKDVQEISDEGVYENGIITWKMTLAGHEEKTISYKAVIVGEGINAYNTAKVFVDNVTMQTNTVKNSTPKPPVKTVMNEMREDINGDYRLAQQELTYTILVENTADILKEFTVVDELPEGVEFMSADSEGVYEDGVVTWKFNLTSTEIRLLTIKVRIKDEAKDTVLKNDAQQYVDNVKVDSNKVENPVLLEPKKEVLNEDGEDINKLNVSNGQILTYRLSVHNAAETEKEFTFEDAVPEFTELYENPDNAEVGEDGSLTWKKMLQPDETWTISFKVKTKAFDVYIPNDAKVSVDEISAKTNLVENFIPKEPLKTVKDENGNDASWDWLVAQDNRELTYGIHFNNPADHDAEFVITDVLDEAWTFIEASDNAEYDEATKTITWKLTLPANTKDYEVTVRVTPIATMAQCKLENDADVKSEQFNHKTNQVVNYLVDDPTTIDLSGVKKWDDESNKLGLRPKYIVVELFANGEAYRSQKVTGKGDEWSYSFTYLPKYMKGAEVVYTVSEYEVDNYIAIVDGMNITNKVLPAPIKDVVKDGKSINEEKITSGDTFDYEITVENIFDEEKEFKITDVLPEGLDFVSASDNGTNTHGIVVWNVKVAANSKYTVKVSVKVNAEAKGTLKNSAEVEVEGNKQITNIVYNPVDDGELPDKQDQTPTPTPQPQQNPKNQTKVVNTGAK